MSFLNPFLAWAGVLAVSVPIVIHLLNRRKFERVVWAAMRFLKVSVEQNQRRIQIEDILLLILRCLLVLLLGLALSRPTFGCSGAARVLGEADVTAVVVLDNSYSMSGTDGVKSRFEQAKMAAGQVLDTMPTGSSVAVILASDVANAVIPEPTRDLAKVRRTLADARLCGRGSNLYPSIRKAVETLKGRPAIRKEIYLVTDGQLTGWKQINDAKRVLDLEQQDVRASVILVGTKLDQNLGVSRLRMASGVAAVGRQLRFEVEVTNYGTADARDVRVTLRADDDPPAEEQTIALVPAGASKTVSLSAKLRDEGSHTITATIPADHLPEDDSRSISVRAVPQVKVLLVDGEPSNRARDSETFFLRHALTPVPASALDTFYMKVTTVESADLGAQKFDGYDVVALANVADFSDATAAALADYLRRGGGLMIFPGDKTQPSFYNGVLASRYHLMPATLGEARGDEKQDARFFTLQGKGFEHPVSAIWSDPGAGSPAAAHVYRAYELTPATDAPAAGAGAAKPPENDRSAAYAAAAGVPRVILSFGPGTGESDLDGKPAVIERTWGLGRVVLFATTASTKWTDLPVQVGVFLPLVDRVVASIVQRQDEALNIKVGAEFVYHPPDETINRAATFFKPGQREEATDSRQVTLTNGVATLTYNDTDLAGEYVVKLPDQPGAVKFSAQTDPEADESSLAEINKPQEDLLGQSATVVHWSPGEPLATRIEQARTGVEIWKQLAWVVIAIAAMETLLAHWFSRTK